MKKLTMPEAKKGERFKKTAKGGTSSKTPKHRAKGRQSTRGDRYGLSI